MRPRELIAERAPTFQEIEHALSGVFTVEPSESWDSDQVYLDTFDGLLRAKRWSLTHESGRLFLSDRWGLAGVEADPLSEPPSGPLLGRDLPASQLRELLLGVIGPRALLPQTRVQLRTEAYKVLDSLQKTIARVNILFPSPHGMRGALSPRVRLHAVRGYASESDRAESLLVAGLGLTPPERSLNEEAVLATGGNPDGISSKPEVAIDAAERTDLAAVRVLRRLLEVMDANIPGTIADVDPEFLHDYRVSVRRSRSVQRELHDAFPSDQLRIIRTEFKWLQEVTGDARDLDVYVLDFDSMRALVPESMRAELDPVLAVLRRRRLVARREMVRELRSERATALRAAWVELLDSLRELPDSGRPMAAIPIGEAAASRIKKVYRKMLKMGEAIDSDSPPGDYHELRKKGKELRYLLELFGAPIHDAAVVKPMVKSLKGLQDVLGRHQDREVQMAMLGGLRGEVSAVPGGAAALMAMGVLVERLEQDAQLARGEFAEQFAAFASAAQRKLVKRTFGAGGQAA